MSTKQFYSTHDTGRDLRIDLLHGDGKAPNVVVGSVYVNNHLNLREAEQVAKAIMDAVREGRAINSQPKAFWR